MIFHICEEKDWLKIKNVGGYKPASLATEGFIHFSTYGQVLATANRLFKKSESLVLLLIDNNLLGSELKWEEADGFVFPHIYRAIHKDEILTTIKLEKDKSKSFVSNKELDRWGKAFNLETSRLLLRDFQTTDFEAVHSYAVDPEIIKYQVWGPNSKRDTKQFLSRTFKAQAEEPREDYEVAVIEKSTGELVGGCRIWIRDQDWSTASIGYTLRRDRHNKGYATEFSQALLDFGFKILKVERIEATCDEENLASKRVLEKIGMRVEQVLEKNMTIRGKLRNTIVAAVLKDRRFEN